LTQQRPECLLKDYIVALFVEGADMFSLIVGSVALIALVMVLLMQLGVMREVVVLQEKVTAFSQLLLQPPVPSFLKKQLPKTAIRVVRETGFREDGPFVLVFMKSKCEGCLRLAEDISQATARGLLSQDAITCFLAEGSTGSKIEILMNQSAKFVAEVSVGVFRSCEVSGTPTMLAINPETWEVFGHSAGGDAAWLMSRLQLTTSRQDLPSPTATHLTTIAPPASN
jgi:hypothetical protein